MADFKVGDRIRLLSGEAPYFQEGDLALLEKLDTDGEWQADFNNQGNREVYGDGHWWVGNNKERDEFELFAPLTPPVSSILLRAHELVNGERAASYGDPSTNFQRWSDLLRPLDIHLSPYQLALVMVAGKLARQVNASKEDNFVDAAGYLEIAHRLEKR